MPGLLLGLASACNLNWPAALDGGVTPDGAATDANPGLDAQPGDDAVVPPSCGDGHLDSGEECDDGNNTDGDGCSAYCTFEGATYSISGSAFRTADTSPEADGSQGILCLSVRTDCADISTEVASSSVYADLSAHTTDTVAWTVSGVPNGTYQLRPFVNMDGGPCDETMEPGDLSLNLFCQQVIVFNVDVTGVLVGLNKVAQ